MECDGVWLPKSLVADDNAIPMPTLKVHVWAMIASVGVSQLAAETMGIWQEKGGMTTQQKHNKVRERIYVIAESMSTSSKWGACPKQWDLLTECSITSIRVLVANRLLWKRYIADNTNLDGQRHKAALDEFPEVGFCRRKNGIDETPNKEWKFMHVGMYFITPMMLLLFPIMCRHKRQQRRQLVSLVLANNGAL